MGFRCRKSIRLFPGVRINLSKSGVSTSIGTPGATINISERGTRGTVGIPGTGLSYGEQLSKPLPGIVPTNVGRGLALWVLVMFLLFVAYEVFK